MTRPSTAFNAIPGTANPDIVIVGAGAAGIAAGLELARARVPFTMLEAAPRIGGRACTDIDSLGHAWDRGAHWFHAAEKNPLRQIAGRIGHPYDAENEGWDREVWRDGRRLDSAAEAANGEALGNALAAIGSVSGKAPDVSTAEAVAAVLSGPHAPYARFLIEVIGGGKAEAMSAIDQAAYDGGETDIAVSGGYGALLARLAAELPVSTATPVARIERRPGGVDVTTPHGSLRARACILTASTAVLASGSIRLEPSALAAIAPALESLPLGCCEKIALELTGNPDRWPPSNKILALQGADVFSLHVRPFGRPIVTANVAGDTALTVAAMTEEDAGALLAEALTAMFGTGLRRAFGREARTSWKTDPLIGGAYSHALVGRAGLRDSLRQADLGPLLLAGEALSAGFFSTVHGAWETGMSAARKAAARLGYSQSVIEAGALPR